MDMRSRLCSVLVLTWVAAACGGTDQAVSESSAPEDVSATSIASAVLEPSPEALALLNAADGDEVAAIVAVILATDHGYSLQQILDGGKSGSLELETGGIQTTTGYLEPELVAQRYVEDSPQLTSLGPLDLSTARQEDSPGRTATREEIEQWAKEMVEETTLEDVVAYLGGGDVLNQLDAERSAKPGHHLSMVLYLIDQGFSDFQIGYALLLGDEPICTSAEIIGTRIVPERCTLAGQGPLNPPQNTLADPVDAENSAGSSQDATSNPSPATSGVSGIRTWTGQPVLDSTSKMATGGLLTVTVTDGVFTVSFEQEELRLVGSNDRCAIRQKAELRVDESADPTRTGVYLFGEIERFPATSEQENCDDYVEIYEAKSYTGNINIRSAEGLPLLESDTLTATMVVTGIKWTTTLT